MEVDWNKYNYLHLYNKYSKSSIKDLSTIADKILSYIPNNKIINSNKLDNVKYENSTGNGIGFNNISSVETTDRIVSDIKQGNHNKQTSMNSNYDSSALKKSDTKEINENHKGQKKRKLRFSSENKTDSNSNSESNTQISEMSCTDLIFDMKYCNLQLPIPLENFQEDDEEYTLETNTSPSITEYDVCYHEEVVSNYVMVEPFRFMSKVHVTFDKESGEQWCCCYFDAIGNYNQKRFKTSNITFDTAKMLAKRCREAAELSFHNLWILKHKNILSRPIPDKITDSFIITVNKIKEYLNNESCMVCCVDKIRETLCSLHQQHLN